MFVYVIVYNYVNVCTSHNNKPFTYLLTYWVSMVQGTHVSDMWYWFQLLNTFTEGLGISVYLGLVKN